MNSRSEELRGLADRWGTAELRRDTATLAEILADDLVGVGPRGFTPTKEQWLGRHEAGNLRDESFGLDEVVIRLNGDAAIGVCRQEAKGVYEDENGRYDIREQFRARLVFVRQQERWLLPSLHLSPVLGRP